MANNTFIESFLRDLHGGHTLKLVYRSYRKNRGKDILKPGGDSFSVYNHMRVVFGTYSVVFGALKMVLGSPISGCFRYLENLNKEKHLGDIVKIFQQSNSF